MGTNKKTKLDPNDVADILIVVRNDGAFAIDKQTILAHATSGGDGFDVKITKDQIIELSSKITQKTKFNTNLKKVVINAIKQAIPRI